MKEVFLKVAKTSILVLFNNFFESAINLLSILFLVQALGLYQFGVLTLALTIISFAEQLLNFGLLPVIETEISSYIGSLDYGKAKSILYRFAQMQLAFGLLFGIGLFFFSFFSLASSTADTAIILRIFSIYVFLSAIKNIFIVSFESFLNFRNAVMLTMTESILRFLLLLLVFTFIGKSVFLAVTIYFAALFFALLLMSMPFLKQLQILFKIPRARENLFVKLAKKDFAFAVLTHQVKNIQANGLPWLLKVFLGTEAVAVYSLIYKGTELIFRFLEPLDRTLLPIIASIHVQADKIKQVFFRLSKYLLFLSILFMLLSWLAIPFIKLVLGKDFQGHEFAFLVLTLSAPIYALSISQRSMLFKNRKQKFIALSTIISFVTHFSAAILFMPFFGIIGAAAAFLLSYAVLFVIRRKFLALKFNLSFKFSEMLKFDEIDHKIVVESKNLILQKLKKKQKTDTKKVH